MRSVEELEATITIADVDELEESYDQHEGDERSAPDDLEDDDD
jgi:hypothetical protein